jgi:hypothetical protein
MQQHTRFGLAEDFSFFPCAHEQLPHGSRRGCRYRWSLFTTGEM